MIALAFGDVVLIHIRFHQGEGGKVRPALVLLDSGDDDFVAAPVTSQPRGAKYDVPLEDWRLAGLNTASYARLHKLTVLSKADVVRRLAPVTPKDRQSLGEALCTAFCPASE